MCWLTPGTIAVSITPAKSSHLLNGTSTKGTSTVLTPSSSNSLPCLHNKVTLLLRLRHLTSELPFLPLLERFSYGFARPAGFVGGSVLDVVRQFWFDSYGNIRFPFGSSQQSNTLVLLHDAFQPLSYWSGFQTPPNWQGVAMDTHIYQMFSQGV